MVAVPVAGEFLAALSTFGSIFTSTIAQATGVTITNTNQIETQKKASWFSKWLDGKGKWLKDFGQKIVQFNKFMIMIARFMPIVKVFIVIILIFSNLLFYVVLIIAYFAIAIVEVIYFVLSLPPFIYVIFLIYFLIVECIPLLIYSMLFLSLLVIITIICIAVLALNLLSGGMLVNVILCQNSPSAWYKVPSFHLTNRYSRGLFCSRPCQKRYYPDPTGLNCQKLPKETPSFCPQASLMRIYAGDGRKDRKFAYNDYKTKANLKYLMKTPERREDELLQFYIKKAEHLDKCINSENIYSLNKYAPLTRNICANLEAMKSSSSLGKFSEKEIKKMEVVCSQSFCDSRASYPFCHKLTSISDVDFSELIRKIITAIIAIIVFILTMIFIVAYINES